MRNKGLVALIMIAMLLIASMAMAAGNFYIPGSRDGEGGIGEDGKSFLNIHGTTDITMEGATSDAYEAIIRIPDPASDIVYTMPAATGTLATTAGTGNALAKDKIFVGSSSALANAVDLSGDATIVESGALSLATGSVDSDEIATDAVEQAELNYEELDWYVEIGASNALATSTGLLFGQPYGMANIGDIGNDMINTVIYHTADIEIIINGTAATDAIHYRGMVLN